MNMFNNYIGERVETHSEHASDTSLMNESVGHLEQRVFVKEEQENNKLLDTLRDFLKFERQTVRTEIKELRHPSNILNRTAVMHESTIEDKSSTDQMRSRVAQLQRQIETLHETYNKKLEEQNSKIVEKNEFFLHLIEQIHSKHSEEVEYYRGVISDFEEEKRQIGNIEHKMNQIGNGIEDILKESSELTKRNEELEGKIAQQEDMLKQARTEIQKYKEIANTSHLKAEQYQKLRLRGIKFQRDLTELLNEAEIKVAEVSTKKQNSHQVCKVYGVHKNVCSHCKAENPQTKKG